MIILEETLYTGWRCDKLTVIILVDKSWNVFLIVQTLTTVFIMLNYSDYNQWCGNSQSYKTLCDKLQTEPNTYYILYSFIHTSIQLFIHQSCLSIHSFSIHFLELLEQSNSHLNLAHQLLQNNTFFIHPPNIPYSLTRPSYKSIIYITHTFACAICTCT